MAQRLENNRLFESLMNNDNISEEDKNFFRREKKEFDEGFHEASREVYWQQCNFNETFVLLEGSTRHCEAKYLPRNFTLYSLAQKSLLENLLKEFHEKNLLEKFHVLTENLGLNHRPRQHQNMYYGLCHFSCLHNPFPKINEPFFTLRTVFYKLGRQIFAKRLKKGCWTEERLEAEIGKIMVLHATKVKADMEVLQRMFPRLPPPLLKDLVVGLIKFSLEHLLLYSYGPDPDPEFVDVAAYLKHFVSDDAALDELPQARWLAADGF